MGSAPVVGLAHVGDAHHVRAGLGDEAQLDEALRMQQGVAAGAGRACDALCQPLGGACCSTARNRPESDRMECSVTGIDRTLAMKAIHNMAAECLTSREIPS